MRGLVVKIFVCSVLVQLVTHAVWVTMAVWFAAAVPGSARMLRNAMPLYAELARTTLEREGPDGLAALLARAQNDGDLHMEVRENVPVCATTLSMGPMAMASGDSRFCLTASPNRPHGLHLWPDGALFLQIGLCALFSYGLACYLLRPIKVLTVTAEALGRGDMTARAGPRLGRRSHGAGGLVRQFDRMADRIAVLIQSQQRFIGDVSHEIKSPLARLTMAIGLARRETNGLAASRFDRMEDEVEAVSALIRELLALSSLEARDAPDRSALVDIDALVRSVIDDAAFEWRDRIADIRLSVPAAGVQVHGDATLLRRAFENVLRNALFYTPPGTMVNVVVSQTGPRVTLLVQDQGPGVPADALAHLFDPFYRVDDARARNTGGIGIGLAICERAIRLHGGAVRAQNVAPSGLAVSLELPHGTGDLIAMA
jgi:two-component system sensor histidine kinase CpxA